MNNTTENLGKRNTKTYSISMQEWKNFHFFLGDDNVNENVTNLLIERGYLIRSGNQSKRKSLMPNQEKITEDARFFAASLCERLAKTRRVRKFGLSKISDNIAKLVEIQDLSVLYFYIANLYGMVFWQVPYNLQRLPVNPDALSMFLSIFANTFIECIVKIDIDGTEGTEEIKEHEED